MTLQAIIPTFRTRDACITEAFYRDKLGFRTTWEHDAGDGHPVFLEIARDDVAIHLSEHAGDGPESVSVYVNVANARALFDAVTAMGAETHGAPEQMEWGEVVFSLSDPDGNVLRFGSPE